MRGVQRLVLRMVRSEMDDDRRRAHDLAALLGQHQQEIIHAWVKAVYELPDSPYLERPAEELHASVMRGLDAIIVALTSESRSQLTNYLADVYLTRREMGIGVQEVVQVLLLCRGAVLPIVRREYRLDLDAAQALATQVDIVLSWMISDLTGSYVTAEGRILKAKQARTDLVLNIIRIATSTLQLDAVLTHVADAIATAIGVQYCGFFLVDEEHGTITPKLEVTVPAVRGAAEIGAFAPHLPQPITTFGALVSDVVGQQEPSVCFNVQTDSRFDLDPLRELGFKSVLAIPFVIEGRVIAVAFALTLEECLAFTDEQIELAHSLAGAAALAIENARLYQQLEQMAVTGERTRLSREIHDDLAPTLGALQLVASMTADQLDGGRIEQARASVRELQEMISDAYTDVREEIFKLRAAVSPDAGFLPTLREYLDDYRMHYGIDIAIDASGARDAVLTGTALVQVIRIVQESLTNIRKHARTARASVRIESTNAHMRIVVQDEGQGFDLSSVTTPDRQYVGLQVMRERAESIGGTLLVDSQPGRGTRVVLDVPVAEHRRWQ